MLWPDCPASPAAWVEPQGREQNLAVALDAFSCLLGRDRNGTGQQGTPHRPPLLAPL